jgi:hypothetical protein
VKAREEALTLKRTAFEPYRVSPVALAIMSQPPARKRDKILRLFCLDDSNTTPGTSANSLLAPSTTSAPAPSPSPAVCAFSVH